MGSVHGGFAEHGRRRLRPGPVRHSSRAPRGRRALRILATAAIFLLSFASATFAIGYSRLQGNIHQTDVEEYLGVDRPTTPPPPQEEDPDPNAGRVRNILVLGSDSREGDNLGVDVSGTSEGMRSDTAMLVHIAADRRHVDVVSIPRDTLVDIPSCRLPDGSTTEPQEHAMFNSAFSVGGASGDVGAGAACAMKTVEKLTGIYVHDFVVVDFTGFINVVDALGGIAMYIPETINDPRADLEIEAGCRLLDGEQALGLARSRYSTEDGSDISRIGRQQDIVMEIIEEALTSRLLTDPIRLYRVLDVSTQTLTTSRGFGNIPQLVGLAGSLAGIDRDSISMVTMPFDYAGARVVPNEAYVQYVWDAINADRPLSPEISGEGWAIAQAGIPAWTPGAVWPPEPTPDPDVSAEPDPDVSAEPDPDGTPPGDVTDAPASDTPDGLPEQPSETATVAPEPPDAAAGCTKENAT